MPAQSLAIHVKTVCSDHIIERVIGRAAVCVLLSAGKFIKLNTPMTTIFVTNAALMSILSDGLPLTTGAQQAFVIYNTDSNK